jgi:hypothetical protein
MSAAASSLRAPRPLDTERGRAFLDRLERIRAASLAIAWRTHERCEPAISDFYDRAIPALERGILGARALCETAARHRQATLLTLVVGLPAVSFACFALTHWVVDDVPAATGLAAAPEDEGSGGVIGPYDGHLRISSTLVEPPTFGARLPTAVLVAARRGDPPVTGDTAAQEMKPEPVTAPPARPAPPTARAAIANVSYSATDRLPSTDAAGPAEPAASPAAVEMASVEAGSDETVPDPAASDDADAARYPFTPRPRPWRALGADTAAQMAPEPEPRAAAGGAPEISYQVQLAAVQGRGHALDLWDSLNRTDSDLLGSLQPDISARTTRRNETIYRLRAGPLNTKADAEVLCAALKSRKVDCLVIRDSG